MEINYEAVRKVVADGREVGEFLLDEEIKRIVEAATSDLGQQYFIYFDYWQKGFEDMPRYCYSAFRDTDPSVNADWIAAGRITDIARARIKEHGSHCDENTIIEVKAFNRI